MSNIPSASPMRLVVLLSGGGTTLKNLLETITAGQLNAEIVLVISSNPQARGLKFAQAAGIATKIIERKASPTPEAYSEAIFEACRATGAAWVLMGGFLTHVLIPPDFENRVLNIHPALIPNFCGKGFFGRRVHEAVLKSGAKYSGCTVHFVDDEYDHGPIILQKMVPVFDDDTPETLAQRVFLAECEAYPEALQVLAHD
jgi:phosphoribosylglycinamide formyltransferase-1